MIRTLRFYLARDLIKITLLTAAALTVLLTVLAFLEPLREQGLTGGQALKYLGYVLLLMCSLTLPFAALFAATIVYGRFSQDNELMASRASGVCTLAVLAPAIWLGAAVTVITLTLGLYVAPGLMGMARRVIKDDLEQIALYHLKKRQYVKASGSRLFHVDQVIPDSRWVRGPVLVDSTDPERAEVMVASNARLDFRPTGDRAVIDFYATQARAFEQGQGSVMAVEVQPLQVAEPVIPSNEPKTYNWNRLLTTWHSPGDSPTVIEGLKGVKRRVCVDRFHAEVLGVLRKRKRYELMEKTARAASSAPAGAGLEGLLAAAPQAPMRVRIEAPHAMMEKDRHVLLRSWAGKKPPPDGPVRKVVVHEYRGGRLRRKLVAEEARIRARWKRYQASPVVTLKLTNAAAKFADEPGGEPRILSRDAMGPFAVPSWLVAESEQINLAQLYDDPDRFNLPGLKKRVDELKSKTVSRLLAKVEAEIHQRLAYGLSCIFMVMMGAALGLLFRGGQMLAAAALSAIPAVVVGLVILMGRKLIANTDVPSIRGIVVIWSGFAALVVATAYVYLVPLRR